MYAKLIDCYVKDIAEKNKLFEAVKTIPIIGKMADWAKKWIDSDAPFAERLVAFSAFEGILFSGPFCAIYWINENRKLPGLCSSNKFIARDEGLHVDYAVTLHKLLKEKCSAKSMHTIINEAVELEIEFINEALPCRLIGMNADMMTMYIKNIANLHIKRFEQVGYDYPELYKNTHNPFHFMNNLLLQSKSNFFEHTPTEYAMKDLNINKVDPYSML